MTTKLDGEPDWTQEPGQSAHGGYDAGLPPEIDLRTRLWGLPPARRDPFWLRTLTRAVRLSVEAASVPVRVARPVVMSRAMAPAREAADFVVGTVSNAMASVVAEQLVYNNEAQALIDAILQAKLKVMANDPLVRQLIAAQADHYLGYLTANPLSVDALVDVAATNFLDSLEARPELLDALVRAVASRYIAALTENPDVLRPLVEEVVADYLKTLEKQPAQLDGIVTEVANRFMRQTRDNPAEVNKLVQVVGDKYMDYLNQNPDDVQQLLAGQTASITKEIVDEVREQSSSADGALENRIRSLLGLKPRSAFPAGPEKIAG